MNPASRDLSTTRSRRSILSQIPADRALVPKYHSLLLDFFAREIEFRKDELTPDDLDGNCFEHLYWCGLLLYLVGDPADVALMWQAKQTNMDTACGFDSQFLVGAGVDNTIRYLKDNGWLDIADYLTNYRQSGELENLSDWEKFRIDYFYGTNGLAQKRGDD